VAFLEVLRESFSGEKQTDKHFLIKPQAITNAASHQAAQRGNNDNNNNNGNIDTSHSLHSK